MEGRLKAALPVAAVVTAACGQHVEPETRVPPRAAPLPVPALVGQPVAVYPLTLVAAEPALGWGDLVGSREEALVRADSVIADFLTARAPEVTWVLPERLRRAAARAPGMLTDPDRMGTAVLRGLEARRVPDPLRAQMRNLTGAVADRYAFVPASLVFVPGDSARGRAELTVALVDVRMGLIEWRTTAWAEGGEPWAAVWEALGTLVPDLP